MKNDNDNNNYSPRQTREIEVVREIGLIIEPSMSLDEILTVVVQKTTRLMQASRSTLFIDEGNGELVSRVLEGDAVNEIRLTPGQGIAGWTAHHKRPLLVADAYEDERFDSSWDQQTGFRTKSVICHPVLDQQNEVVGVIEALNKRSGVFTTPDLELLSLISEQIALNLQNFRLMFNLVQKNQALAEARQGLRQRNQEISLLLDLERCVAESADLKSLFSNILIRTCSATSALACLIYRIDEMGAEIRVVSHNQTKAATIRTTVGIGIPGWVASKGKPISTDAPASDPRFSEALQKHLGFEIKSIAAVPLQGTGTGMQKGSLVVYNKKNARGFGDDDMMMLKSVGQRLSHAVISFLAREQQERDSRLATIGRLLAGVVHDLRSPMTVISGYTQLLSEQMEGKGEELHYLDGLSRAVDRMTTMAQEIISFSKGEQDLLISSRNIASIVERFETEMAPILEANQITLTKTLHTKGKISVDEDKLQRVFQNIAMNAIEAMGEGGNLEMDVYINQDMTVFSLADNGPGIPDEIRGSLFQSFVTYGKTQGTGLGLAVAKEMIEAHGGMLDFTTAKDRGTTFFVRLPNGAKKKPKQ